MNENTPNPWDDQPKDEAPVAKTKTKQVKVEEIKDQEVQADIESKQSPTEPNIND